MTTFTFSFDAGGRGKEYYTKVPALFKIASKFALENNFKTFELKLNLPHAEFEEDLQRQPFVTGLISRKFFNPLDQKYHISGVKGIVNEKSAAYFSSKRTIDLCINAMMILTWKSGGSKKAKPTMYLRPDFFGENLSAKQIERLYKIALKFGNFNALYDPKDHWVCITVEDPEKPAKNLVKVTSYATGKPVTTYHHPLAGTKYTRFRTAAELLKVGI